MNPNDNSNQPAPVTETSPVPLDNQTASSAVPVPPPLTPLPADPAAVPVDNGVPPAPVAAPLPTTALQQLQSGATDTMTQAPIADEDNLVLDREWIEKAKHIVEQTAADPYEQNRRLAEVKADYLQKRYGKTIKLAE